MGHPRAYPTKVQKARSDVYKTMMSLKRSSLINKFPKLSDRDNLWILSKRSFPAQGISFQDLRNSCVFHIAKNILANETHVTLYSCKRQTVFVFTTAVKMLRFLILEKMISCLHLPDELGERCVEKEKKKGCLKNALN